MAIITHIERELATVVNHEPISHIVLNPLREVIPSVIENVTIATYISERETSTITSRISGLKYSRSREWATIFSRVQGSTTGNSTVRDTATSLSRSTISLVVTSTEREVASTTSRVSYDNNIVLREVIGFLAREQYSVSSYTVVRDVASFVSRASGGTEYTAREIFNATSRVTSSGNLSFSTRETARALSNYSIGSSSINITARGVASFISRPSINAFISETQSEVAYSYSTAILQNVGAAYTCDVGTWGMTKYSNYPFITIAGNFAADISLYSIGATTDDGSTIQSIITTGKIDFEVAENKHINYLYINGSSDSQFNVSVTGDTVRALDHTQTFTMPPRNQMNTRNSRVSIGRGFMSRYYQFTIVSNGAQFKLNDIEANVSVSNRRI